jgi:preflagellin peptidase FlaK
MVLLGIVFLGYDYSQVKNITAISPFIISLGISFLLAVVLYYTGLISGGDGKILIGIGALIPVLPYPTYTAFPIFSLSVFTNAVFLSALLPLAFFIYNLKHLRAVKSPKEFFVLFLGYKKKASEIKDYEAIIGEGKRYKFFLSTRKTELGKKIDGNGKIWVTPAIPFLIPLTIGFIISASYGDILSYFLIWM